MVQASFYGSCSLLFPENAESSALRGGAFRASRSLSGIYLLFLKFRNATMRIGISLVAGDRSKRVVATQERRDIEWLRRLESEKGLLAAF